MSQSNRSSRRQFITATAQGAALIGAAGGMGYLLTREQEPSATGRASRKKGEATTLIRTEARRARKIAVGPDDRIYVAADRSILVFESDGTRLPQIPLSRPARCLAVRPDGRLLVGLVDHVEVLGADGKRQTAWDRPAAGAILASVAIGKEKVFVADAANRVVWRYDHGGRLLGRIGRDSGFAAPAEFFAIAVANDGTLHIGNPGRHRIETWSADGVFLSQWGQRSRQLAGFSGCCNPVSFALLPDGRCITAERGQPRVKLYDANGRFASLLAGPETFAANARAAEGDNGPGCRSGGLDVSLDARGRVLVLDRVTGIVHVFA